eukprot:546500_1
MAEQNLKVNVHFNDNCYEWVQSTEKLSALKTFVKQKYKIDAFELGYDDDEEQTRQMINDDSDFDEALELAEEQGELNIYVVVDEEKLDTERTTTSPAAEFDFKMFENESTDCNSDFICTGTERLMTAMEYYQSLDMANDQDKQKLSDFYDFRYKHILNDFSHLILKHYEELDTMYEFATNIMNLKQCTAEKCLMLRRHNRDRDNEDKDTQFKSQYEIDLQFKRDTMDAIHCYILHQYDFGFAIYHKNDAISEEM